jgi:hypothetical protein
VPEALEGVVPEATSHGGGPVATEVFLEHRELLHGDRDSRHQRSSLTCSLGCWHHRHLAEGVHLLLELTAAEV